MTSSSAANAARPARPRRPRPPIPRSRVRGHRRRRSRLRPPLGSTPAARQSVCRSRKQRAGARTRLSVPCVAAAHLPPKEARARATRCATRTNAHTVAADMGAATTRRAQRPPRELLRRRRRVRRVRHAALLARRARWRGLLQERLRYGRKAGLDSRGRLRPLKPLPLTWVRCVNLTPLDLDRLSALRLHPISAFQNLRRPFFSPSEVAAPVKRGTTLVLARAVSLVGVGVPGSLRGCVFAWREC